MHFPTPLRLATFAASILLRAVLVNHVAEWLQTQGVESAIRAVFDRQTQPGDRIIGPRGEIIAGPVSGEEVILTPRVRGSAQASW